MLSDLYRTLSEEVQRCIADAVRGAHDKVMTEHTQKLQQPKSTLGSKPTTEVSFFSVHSHHQAQSSSSSLLFLFLSMFRPL
jgi:hypothetical protein